jgi:hypothetical protein
MLGMNPGWASAQTIQNILTLPFTTFDHPGDAPRSLLAWAAGFDPKVHEMLHRYQPELLGHLSFEDMVSHFDRQAERWQWAFDEQKIPFSEQSAKLVAGVTAPIEWYKQRIFSAAQMGDNYARTVAFYHSVAKQMDAIPAYRMPLRNAFNLQARHLQVEQAMMLDEMHAPKLEIDPHNFDFPDVLPIHNTDVTRLNAEIEKHLNNAEYSAEKIAQIEKLQDQRNKLIQDAVKRLPPEQVPAVAKKLFGQIAAEDVYAWFGKYDGLTAQEWAGMRKLVPFWLWWMHAVSIAGALPTRAPLRTALLGRLMKTTPLVLQPQNMADKYKKMGVIPVTTRQRGTGKEIPLVDAAGFKQLESGSAWVPITQITEFQAEINKMLKGNNEPVSVPFLNFGVQAANLAFEMFQTNILHDPSTWDTKGKRFNEKGEEVKNTPLPLENIAGKLLIPGFHKNIQEHISFPYKPSDQTTLFNDKQHHSANQYNGRFVPQSKNVNAPIAPPLTNEAPPFDRLQMMSKQYVKGDTMPEVMTQGQEATQKAYNLREFYRARGRHPKAQE